MDKTLHKRQAFNSKIRIVKQQPKEEEKEEEDDVLSFNDFSQFITKENVLRGIFSYGFNKPSKIQSLAIKPIKDKKDVIAQSQSGTGKTGAFALGILESIDENKKYPQSMILAHTRELVLQTEAVIKELGKYLKNSEGEDALKVAICCGKTSVDQNAKDIKESQIIIGTPGRIQHMIRERAFDINKINLVVLDEADQLLNQDFVEQTKKIIGNLSSSCQICIFSATLPREIINMTECFMKEPEKLLIRKEKLSLKLIAQYYIDAENDDNKLDLIEDLYCKFSIAQSIIYVNSIDKAEWLAKTLSEKSHTVGLMHSNLDPAKRLEVMKLFRSGKTRVLISTDLTSRGIDVQQVGVVINYDLPKDPETYLHRIGRSGRFNKRGVAISLIGSKRDKFTLKDIESFYRIKIDVMPEIDVINAFLSS
jgi:translation initiation factor 4A